MDDEAEFLAEKKKKSTDIEDDIVSKVMARAGAASTDGDNKTGGDKSEEAARKPARPWEAKLSPERDEVDNLSSVRRTKKGTNYNKN